MCATVLESWNATSFAPSRWEVRRLNIPNTYTARNICIYIYIFMWECQGIPEQQAIYIRIDKKSYVCIYTHRYCVIYIYVYIYTVSKDCSVVYV